MSRQIQYRAWDTEAKDWVRSSITIYEHICQWELSDTTKCCSKEKWIVEQYTGLRDRNGRKIYEGDIVRFYPHTSTFVVVYDRTAFRLKGFAGVGCAMGELDSPLEVIGNIHEDGRDYEVKPEERSASC